MAPPISSPFEIFCWLLYDAANGAFFYGVLNFVPLILLDQGREIAHQDVCRGEFGITPDSQVMGWTTLDCEGGGAPLNETDWCACLTNTSVGHWEDISLTGHLEAIPERSQVWFLGSFPVQYPTLWSSTTTASVLCQLFSFLFFSSVGDFGGLRKVLFFVANTIGGIACLIIGFYGTAFDESALDLNVVCAIVANLTMGYAAVMYYAYLPLLVDNHEDVLKHADGTEEKTQSKELVESRLSSQGVRAGMAGQTLYLVIAAACILTGLLDMPQLIIFGGLWVLFLGTFAIYNLEGRPGSPLPEGSGYCKESIDKLGATCQKRSKLPQLFMFLLSYFIFSDGTATTASQAATFAGEVLKADTSTLILLLIAMSIAAIFGTIATIMAQERLGWSPRTLLIGALTIQMFLPIFALYMTTLTEMYVVATIFGLATGPQQSYTRSIYSSTLPKGREAEFFGLYEITDKGTAWAGPLMVTFVTNLYSFRIGYFSLILFFMIGIPILFCFDHPQAILEKKSFEKWEEEEKTAHEGLRKRSVEMS